MSFLDMKNKMVDGVWILVGDFNLISNSYERKRSLFVNRKSEQMEFKAFIEEWSLVDLPCYGNSFSWFSGDGKFMSRIDKFLLSDSLIERWEVVDQFIRKRDISYHCPV